MKIVYADSNIYIDYFKDRRDRWRYLGELAIQFFNRILEEKEFKLVVSDHLKEELYNNVKKEIVDGFLQPFIDANLIVNINKTEEDIVKAKKISDHYQDPLHAILAQKAGAAYLVTRNIKDFPLDCIKMVEIILPESLP